jgi:hypothetical protein
LWRPGVVRIRAEAVWLGLLAGMHTRRRMFTPKDLRSTIPIRLGNCLVGSEGGLVKEVTRTFYSGI